MSKPLKEQVSETSAWIRTLRAEVGRVIVGQEQLVERLLVGLLANGHVLLEGVPGLAKTLSVRTLAAAVQASFRRIQFTPDLLPADIVGNLIYNPQDGKYHVTKGPVFANFVLADEINRAPAKVQSALLEAMQERQVTLGGETLRLPSPFLVLATENPIDQEGTYPLPEAQVDRFMFKVVLDYPSFEEERNILDRMAFTSPEIQIKPVVSLDEILHTQKIVDQIHVDEKIRDYIVKIVFATRLGAVARPRLCDSRRREKHRAGCVAPPHHPDLRGRGAIGDERRHRQKNPERRAGAMKFDGTGVKILFIFTASSKITTWQKIIRQRRKN
jgi:MoxR-like ATPase